MDSYPTQNVAGITNSFGWLSDMMGTPYTLPVYEDFAKGRRPIIPSAEWL